jgi:general secretion pathway protein M
MSAGFLAWWRTRTVREQRMLLVMGVLLAICFAWLAIVRPMDKALARERARHDRAVLARADARAEADAIMAITRGRGTAPAGSIPALVGQRASEAGFTAARIEPEGDGRAAVVIDAVNPRVFFPWAAAIEQRDGLVVDSLSAKANSDATLAVRASFRARG